jgi:formylglycine-generating enzyme required for sulfatase activity
MTLSSAVRMFVVIQIALIGVGLSLVSAPLVAGGLKPGDTVKDCKECPELVVIPPGNFRMGGLNSGSYDTTRRAYPIHKVIIRYSFAVGKYEVTFSQWDACVSDGGCTNNPSPDDRGWGRGNRPVMVSWKNSKEFVSWLRQKTGKDYRLLSEAEWEYMARAGTSTIFPWGNTSTKKHARFDSDSTVPVGSFEPNLFGIYDVVGNVWEWVEDCWHRNYVGAPSNGKAWGKSGRHNCNRRVMRGGGHTWASSIVRLSYRYSGSIVGVTESRNHAGFRVARSVSP